MTLDVSGGYRLQTYSTCSNSTNTKQGRQGLEERHQQSCQSFRAQGAGMGIKSSHLCYGFLFGTDCQVFLGNHMKLAYDMKTSLSRDLFKLGQDFLKEKFPPGVSTLLCMLMCFHFNDHYSKDFYSRLYSLLARCYVRRKYNYLI